MAVVYVFMFDTLHETDKCCYLAFPPAMHCPVTCCSFACNRHLNSRKQIRLFLSRKSFRKIEVSHMIMTSSQRDLDL
jgi:hypothetical protein